MMPSRIGVIQREAMDLETLARLGIESTGPPKAMRSTGELDYIYDC